jgi:superfamily II DNA/RNA helicase
MKFSEFGFCDALMEGIDAMGFEKATEVQEKTIPFTLKGKDMIACAQTGTGKTAAFLLPVMDQIFSKKLKGTNALIIAPTRELAVQIDQQFQGMAYFLGLTSIAVYGGRSSDEWELEKKALTQGADVVIATPGRLISHLNLGYVKFNQVKFLILDEADRMLDMGFNEDIMKIAKHLPKEKQTLMFSATMPSKIRQLATKLLHTPEQVNVAISTTAKGVTQQAYMAHDGQKGELLKRILKAKDYDSVIVFASRKTTVKDVSRFLKKAGFAAAGISSDLEQKEREELLLQFRTRKIKVVVATDVLSRGIDIDGINLVVNYDVPGDAEDYVHRVGRTARADATGEAITLISSEGVYKFDKIEKLIKQTIEKLPLPADLGEAPEYKITKGGGGGNFKGRKKFSGGNGKPKSNKWRGKPRPQHGGKPKD